MAGPKRVSSRPTTPRPVSVRPGERAALFAWPVSPGFELRAAYSLDCGMFASSRLDSQHGFPPTCPHVLPTGRIGAHASVAWTVKRSDFDGGSLARPRQSPELQ